MLAGKILKMSGNFKEIYIGRGLTEDGGSVSLKKKKTPSDFYIFNIFFLVFIKILTTFESNDYWILFCF